MPLAGDLVVAGHNVGDTYAPRPTKCNHSEGWEPTYTSKLTSSDNCQHFDGYTTIWCLYIVVFIESVAFSRRLRALTGIDECQAKLTCNCRIIAPLLL